MLANDIRDNDLVVFHSLASPFYSFVLILPKKIKTVWMCFGFEVYNDARFFSENKLLDTITQKTFFSKPVTFKYRIREKVRPFYRIIKPNLPLSGFEIKKKVFNRIDFLGSSFKEEFSTIQKLIGEKKVFFSFWYYPLEQIISISEELIIERPNILIGNSGFKTGNHLDVFHKLKTIKIVDKKLIVPLSYGNSEYIDLIINEGKTQFENIFDPLLDFISLEEYNKVIKHCGIAILNNRRQQAIGNTIALLWYGSKIFLSNQNPFYLYLKRIGIYVYCYETEFNSQSINELLTLDQINDNRLILKQHLSSKLMQSELEKQINSIYG
ncbi:MAG TPA: TDP-N-acetylfucosamine:lipid II N-acetylfucosaminyltransferase [Flavobacterium sp.]|nr:TDP-N-acetylfucosamine:lipid II N-acetylfucosaminyltransferase [Flavobacterium sp.]